MSNCIAKNNRSAVATELQKYIPVDIFGACGTKVCPRQTENACFDMLQKEYKFYLSFENSNCRDYLTEKLFTNALQNEVIPVVMGGRVEDYLTLAPEHSFIHVDEFASIEHLAEYLKLLDSDDRLYNSYFRWKGTGELINTHYWCRVCAVMHALDRDERHRTLHESEFNQWWKKAQVCTK